MSQHPITFLVFPIPLVESLSVQKNLVKQDSQTLSIFQAVGMSYRVMDAMIELGSTFEHAAAKFFVDTLMSDGWDRRGRLNF